MYLHTGGRNGGTWQTGIIVASLKIEHYISGACMPLIFLLATSERYDSWK